MISLHHAGVLYVTIGSSSFSSPWSYYVTLSILCLSEEIFFVIQPFQINLPYYEFLSINPPNLDLSRTYVSFSLKLLYVFFAFGFILRIN